MNLKETRYQLGLSQEALSRLLDVSTQTVRKWEFDGVPRLKLPHVSYTIASYVEGRHGKRKLPEGIRPDFRYADGSDVPSSKLETLIRKKEPHWLLICPEKMDGTKLPASWYFRVPDDFGGWQRPGPTMPEGALPEVLGSLAKKYFNSQK